MTIVSRLELDHPVLGTAGGSGLHASIEAIYIKLGNNMADRFFYVKDLNAAASADCDHNYNTAIGNLRIDIYSWNESTGELTFLTESTTPKRSEIAVIAKVGDTLKQITVTNNSSAQVDLGIVTLHDPIEINELIDVDTTGVTNGQVLTYETSTLTWKPATKATYSDATKTVAGLMGIGNQEFSGDKDFFGIISIKDAFKVNRKEITSAYTVDSGTQKDNYLVCKHTAALAIALISAATAGIGRQIIIKDMSASGAFVYNITLTPNGSDTIEGTNSYILMFDKISITLISDGVSNWEVN